jgi:hypothetical protein
MLVQNTFCSSSDREYGIHYELELTNKIIIQYNLLSPQYKRRIKKQ